MSNLILSKIHQNQIKTSSAAVVIGILRLTISWNSSRIKNMDKELYCDSRKSMKVIGYFGFSFML